LYIEASYDHDQSKNQKVVHEKAASVLEKQIPQEDLEQMIRNIEFVVTGVQKRPTTEEAKNQFIGQLLDVLERAAANDDSQSNTGVETSIAEAKSSGQRICSLKRL